MFDFLTVGKTLKNFGNELAELRKEIETLTREREDVHYAPAPVDDVVAAIEVWAKSNATKYRDYLQGIFVGLVNHPGRLSDNAAVWNHLREREIAPDPSPYFPISRDVQLCGLLGPEAFTALMRRQLEAMQWPTPGLPASQRKAAIDAIETKIEKLRAREIALLRSAEKAGLTIS